MPTYVATREHYLWPLNGRVAVEGHVTQNIVNYLDRVQADLTVGDVVQIVVQLPNRCLHLVPVVDGSIPGDSNQQVVGKSAVVNHDLLVRGRSKTVEIHVVIQGIEFSVVEMNRERGGR